MTKHLAALVAVIGVVTAGAPATAADAKAMYAKRCAVCHGKDGAPSPTYTKLGVRSFRDEAWQKSVSDAQLEQSIREGRKGTVMVPFKDALSAEEIQALVKHVRELGKQ
jgi:cytochrome c6